MAGSDNFTGQNIQDSYQRVLQISSSGELADGTGSLVPLLYVTASYAITEVNYETSSSYAETASFITNDVHALTSTEVNQLKNIGSNAISNEEWSSVAGMQAVGTTNSPQFGSIELKTLHPSTPTIQLPSDANSGSLHLKVRDSGGPAAPGIYLGSNGDSVLYGVNELGMDVWNIDQMGNFSGQSALSTYAANLNGTPDISVGQMTASGDISASGDIRGYLVKGYQVHSEGGFWPNVGTSNANITGLSDHRVFINHGLYVHSDQVGKGGGHIHATGNITASGNISASGAVVAQDFATPGKIYLNSSIIDTGTDYIDYANGGFLYKGNGKFYGHITASGNISASGTAIFGGDAIIAGNISERGSLLSFVYAPRIGSSYITTLGQIGTGTWKGSRVESVYLDDDTAHLTTDQTFTGNKTFSAPITASGNISASGTIYGRQFEQIIQNFTGTMTSYTDNTAYLPWTDNDTENNVSTGKYVNKVAAVPGRPVRTIIRALSNWDLAGGSAAAPAGKSPRSYTASFWTQKSFELSSNTIKRMSCYVDSRQHTTNIDTREHLVFDWRTPSFGTVGDCDVGDKLWMTLTSDNEESTQYAITTIFEWDYGSLI